MSNIEKISFKGLTNSKATAEKSAWFAIIDGGDVIYCSRSMLSRDRMYDALKYNQIEMALRYKVNRNLKRRVIRAIQNDKRRHASS